MLTISPIKLTTFTKKYISFGENQNAVSRVGLMSIDKNPSNKINFEKDLYETRKADMVQSNPIKAIGYNIVKAYNILSTPTRRTTQTESRYIHVPYMA